MWIETGILHSKLARATEEERGWVTAYLTFDIGARDEHGNVITKGGNEPERVCLFNAFTHTYPAGFDQMIAKAAKADGLTVSFLDKRVPPCTFDPQADLAWLRDYQLASVMRIVERHRGILWLGTGAGKTEIAVGLTRALPCKWLALVHRSQLADDIASRFEKRSPGLRAGRVLEGRFDVQDDDSLVACTFQSLAAMLKKPKTHRDHYDALMLLQTREGLIIDECHTTPADSFYALIMRTKNAYYRVGLSGTPLARGDAKGQYLLAATGPIVHRVRADTLIKAGVLAKPTIRMVTVEQDSARPTWTGVYGELIARSTLRNAVVADMTRRATKPAFVFVEQVEHGRDLAKLMFKHGMKAEFVWGSHSIDYRKSLIRRMVQGHFDVIVCSRVFNEGIDVPELRAVVNAGGMKSIIATLQRAGRGMRVDRDAAGVVREGGAEFEVWDVLDKGNQWTAKHARIRQSAYTNEGFETFVEPLPTSLSALAVKRPRRRAANANPPADE